VDSRPFPTLRLQLERRLEEVDEEPGSFVESSAATVDRLLRPVREKASGGRKSKAARLNRVRKIVPVRTFADWEEVGPGFMEMDMVVHCGTKTVGTFVHSLVLTDVASGWTECLALPVREQTLIVEAITGLMPRLPFPLLGLDTDNDSAFMNDTLWDYCQKQGIVFTRSRAYRKNDQAWVEQKNGAIVRKLIGYGRLEGLSETAALRWPTAVPSRHPAIADAHAAPSPRSKMATETSAVYRKSGRMLPTGQSALPSPLPGRCGVQPVAPRVCAPWWSTAGLHVCGDTLST
jgi:hypothetical protein